MIGRSLGPYRIVHRLGSGGMGEVYLADDARRNRQVALKVLHTKHLRELPRLHAEARAASAIDHPNVARIYEISEADGVTFLAMEYVRGSTLDTLIAGRNIDVDKATRIAAQIAEALVAAEGEGITHRDLKPANIMITEHGTAKVLDFGLARVQAPGTDTGPRLTAPGVIVGTLDYMSPEQALASEVDTRSDIFSLGVILYECVTGARPFSGLHAAETMNRLLHFEPDSPSDLNPAVSPAIAQVIAKCTAKLPSERYQRASDLVEDLHAILENRSPERPLPSPPPVENRRWRTAAVVGGVVLFIAVIALSALYWA